MESGFRGGKVPPLKKGGTIEKTIEKTKRLIHLDRLTPPETL